jgi:hypothetical protein
LIAYFMDPLAAAGRTNGCGFTSGLRLFASALVREFYLIWIYLDCPDDCRLKLF